MTTQAEAQQNRERLADSIEDRVERILDGSYWSVATTSDLAGAIRDLAEAAVILRWQRLPGRDTLR